MAIYEVDPKRIIIPRRSMHYQVQATIQTRRTSTVAAAYLSKLQDQGPFQQLTHTTLQAVIEEKVSSVLNTGIAS
jgi:hypothetical protein